jgi:hypothetical protein
MPLTEWYIKPLRRAKYSRCSTARLTAINLLHLARKYTHVCYGNAQHVGQLSESAPHLQIWNKLKAMLKLLKTAPARTREKFQTTAFTRPAASCRAPMPMQSSSRTPRASKHAPDILCIVLAIVTDTAPKAIETTLMSPYNCYLVCHDNTPCLLLCFSLTYPSQATALRPRNFLPLGIPGQTLPKRLVDV